MILNRQKDKILNKYK